MNCEQIAELLPDYLQGSLTREQASEVEQHCERCASCGQDVAMWKKLALLPAEQPSPESRVRFETMLHTYPTTGTDQGFPAQTANDRGKGNARWAFFDWLRSP